MNCNRILLHFNSKKTYLYFEWSEINCLSLMDCPTNSISSRKFFSPESSICIFMHKVLSFILISFSSFQFKDSPKKKKKKKDSPTTKL